MVAFPVLSGLSLGGWSLGGLAFAALVAASFLAYESAILLLGVRGPRLRRSLGPRARASLSWLVPVGLAAGAGFLLTAPSGALAMAGVPAALGLAVAAMVAFRTVKTLPGEVLVGAAFASVHLPVAAAGGAVGTALWAPAAVWLVAFVLATLTVHSLKVRSRRRGPGRWTVPVTRILAAVTIAIGAGAALGEPSLRFAAAVIPLALVLMGLSLVPVSTRHLRRIGWTLVGADLATLMLLTVLVPG